MDVLIFGRIFIAVAALFMSVNCQKRSSGARHQPAVQHRVNVTTYFPHRQSKNSPKDDDVPDLEIDVEEDEEWQPKTQIKTRTKRRKVAGGFPQKGRDSSRRYRYKVGSVSNEFIIKRKLLRVYDKTSRPVKNDSTTTTTVVGMSLYHILDTNEKFQTLSALIAVRVRWIDEYLKWNPKEYGGVDQIWIPAIDIWTPDIFINNFADDSFQDFMNTFAIVSHHGEVLWMFPAVVKTYCTLDVRHFPFDRQACNIVFISWTFNGFKVDVTYNETEKQTVYYTPKNQEWYVDKIAVERHEKIYACCEEPYPDVTFTIHMTRRSLFYVINLIFPCLLIYAVSFLGFFLPVESGEKVNLEITILLALVVFLLMIGETLPPTPDAIPALGVLFGTTMIMVSIALLMAVIVTNLYMRRDSGTRVPLIIRKIFLSGTRRDKVKAKAAEMNHVNHGGEDLRLHDLDLDHLSLRSESESPSCRARCAMRARRSPSPNPRTSCGATEDLELRMSLEWQSLAKCVDRINFWIFLLASVALMAWMFVNTPQYHDPDPT